MYLVGAYSPKKAYEEDGSGCVLSVKEIEDALAKSVLGPVVAAGWFNVGKALNETSPKFLLASKVATGKAAVSEPSFKKAKTDFTTWSAAVANMSIKDLKNLVKNAGHKEPDGGWLEKGLLVKFVVDNRIGFVV